MNIRFAAENDIPRINSLLYQVAAVHAQGRPDLFRTGAKKYNDDELRSIIEDDNRPIFVAEQNGKVVGYAFCIIEQQGNRVLTDIKTLYIDDLCVDEKCRGQHIGEQLYNFVKDYAKQIGCYNLTLNVWSCNPSAMRFYEKMGLTAQKIGMEQIL